MRGDFICSPIIASPNANPPTRTHPICSLCCAVFCVGAQLLPTSAANGSSAKIDAAAPQPLAVGAMQNAGFCLKNLGGRRKDMVGG